jgi:hypothetical protein
LSFPSTEKGKVFMALRRLGVLTDSRARATSFALAFVLVSGCSSDSTTPQAAAPDGGATCSAKEPLLAADCDPLGGFCGLPFPSNVYLKEDPTGASVTGKRVEFGADTLPKTHKKNPDGTTTEVPLDTSMFHGFDGFSPASAPMIYIEGATADGLPNPEDLARSVTTSSPSILLDADTGQLVPHWVDLDALEPADQAMPALIMHPAVLLTNEARYIVAFRHLKDASGGDIAPSAVFKAIRDGEKSDDPSVSSRRCLYEDIFGKLDKAGISKDDLQVAWDFSVGSKKSITDPIVKVRDAALSAVGADGPDFTLKVVAADPANGVEGLPSLDPNPHIWHRMILTMKAPLFLDSATFNTGANPPQAVPALQWNADGTAKQNGTMDVDVLVQVPNSVKTGVKHGLLQNGHGLFGSKNEGRNGYMAVMCDDYHWVELAVDFYGFSGEDPLIALQGLTDRPELLPGFFARQIQGHVNQLVAMRLMMGRIARDGVKDASGNVLIDPGWIDPSLRAYRGDSQGGIMGGTYMTISTDVTRGFLGEPGTPYAVLLNRSVDSVPYHALLLGAYPDGRAAQLMWQLIQMHWDRTEPSGFVPFMTENTLPGTPPHHVLMHDAIGDHQVTTYGAHIMARGIGAKLLESNDAAKPLVREVYGLERAKAPLQDASALVEWDFALPAEVLTNSPSAAGCDPHDRVRVTLPAYQQQDTFFRTGSIDWYCNGVCNCDGPAEEQGCADTFKPTCP